MSGDNRRLAAIMFTDMVGYSSIAHQDDSLAQEILQEHRNIIRPIISKHHGKEIKSTGDGFLVEFVRPVEAVRCAIEMQGSLQTYNSIAKSNKHIHIRIGIHLGEVEEVEGDIYGDGVNTAARIESLAETDGICISDAVFSQVRNRINMPLVTIGKPELKNIDVPIEIYKVKLPTLESDAAPDSTSPDSVITAEKSIAVLPFRNMSPDPDNEYFSDGITEEIIDALTQIEDLKVISRTSAFYYKGKDFDLKTVGDRLGVDHILEGSVRKTSDRLRITAQLIRVSDDSHLWSQKFDREMGDIFDIQEEIAESIVDQLKPRLSSYTDRIGIGYTKTNPEAFEAYLRGKKTRAESWSKESLQKSLEYFQTASSLDPGFAEAYAMEARILMGQHNNGFISTAEVKFKARELVDKALSIDPSLSSAHTADGILKWWIEKDLPGAVGAFKKALQLDPGNAEAHSNYASHLFMSEDRYEEAFSHFKRAVELDPLHLGHQKNLGVCYEQFGNFEQALKYYEKSVEINPKSFQGYSYVIYMKRSLWDWDGVLNQSLIATREVPDDPCSHLELAFNHLLLGRNEDAKAAMNKALKLDQTTHSEILLGEIYSFVRDYEKAAEHLTSAIEKNTLLQFPHFLLGRNYIFHGEYEEAFRAFDRCEELSAGSGDTGARLSIAGYRAVANALMGKQKLANSCLEKLSSWPLPSQPGVAFYSGLIHLAMGDSGSAFKWLDLSAERHDPQLPIYISIPLFDQCRSDEKYEALLRRMGLSQKI